MKRVLRTYLPAVMALLAASVLTGLGPGVNRWLTDVHWRIAAARSETPFPDDIVIVAIDDRTVREFGRLRYWSRQRYADLLPRLVNARAVAFDVLFTEPDVIDAAGDRAFADAIAAQGRVILACFEWSEIQPFDSSRAQYQSEAVARFPAITDAVYESAFPHPVRFERFELPVPELFSAAAAVGTADLQADADGVFRSPILLKATTHDVAVPHLMLATALVATERTLEDVCAGRGDELMFGARRVPFVCGRLYLHPIVRRDLPFADVPGKPVPIISFVDALTKPPAFFADKIVLIGETATGTADIRPNPLDSALRGVTLNAEILANLLKIAPVRPMPAVWALGLAVLAIGSPLTMCRQRRALRTTIDAAALLILEIGAMEAAFWLLNWLPPWATVLVGGIGGMAVMALHRYLQEEQAKREMRRCFSAYVSPKLVESIVEDPDIAMQQGVRRSVAVLFSDIRSFTTYCEHHSPEFVVQQMREYFDAMSHRVEEADGVLDKYVGDAVMALWGPFLADDCNRSALAIRCALRMQEDLKRLNSDWETRDMPPFRIGIGIHAGEAVVGNVGSTRRMQYTALGDAVNLAARLESETKTFGADILVSNECKEEVEDCLAGTVEFIPRGQVTVKGRVQSTTVYEVRALTTGCVPDQKEGLADENGAE